MDFTENSRLMRFKFLLDYNGLTGEPLKNFSKSYSKTLDYLVEDKNVEILYSFAIEERRTISNYIQYSSRRVVKTFRKKLVKMGIPVDRITIKRLNTPVKTLLLSYIVEAVKIGELPYVYHKDSSIHEEVERILL
jgi:hypothetical protein